MRLNRKCCLFIFLIIILILGMTFVSANNLNDTSVQSNTLKSTSHDVNNNLIEINNNEKVNDNITTKVSRKPLDMSTQTNTNRTKQLKSSDKQIKSNTTVVNKANLQNKKAIKTADEKNYIYVTSNGDINSDGSTINTPTTFNHALNIVTNNYTIYLITESDSDTYLLNSPVNIDSSTVKTGTSYFNITGQEGKTITFNGQNITNILNIGEDYAINITNIAFINGHASDKLGVIGNHATLNMYNCDINNNYADYDVIYNEGTIRIQNSNINNNTATNAVIYNNGVEKNASAFIGSSSIKDNRGVNGAVIYNDGLNANADLTYNVIKNNTVTENGGLVYNNNATVRIHNNTITNTSAVNGGIIYNYGLNAKTNITYTVITNSSSTSNGGLVYNNKGIVRIHNNTITNTSAVNGGIVYNYGQNTNTTLSLCYINNTIVTGNGAIVYNDNATARITAESIIKNITAANGGLLYNINQANASLELVTVNDTIVTGNGGIVYNDNSTFTLVSITHITNTTANGNGGAFYVVNTANLGIKLLNTTLTTATNGGLAYFNNVTGNFSTYNNMYNSKATNNGGFIYMTNSNITTNVNYYYNSTSGANGGVIYINNSTLNTTNYDRYVNATANLNGGFIYINNSNIYLNNIRMDNSTSKADGGAIYSANSTLTIRNSNFANTTATNGGLIYINNTNLTGSDLFAYDSNATLNGGFIYANNATLNILNYSEFHRAIAGKDGGVIYDNNTNLTFVGDVVSNKAGGNGGAFYNINSNVDFTRTVTYYYGSSTRTTTGLINLKNNNATNGGGIYNENVTMTLICQEIQDNHATENGGAIYNKNVTMLNSALGLNYNTAGKDGGAMYNTNATINTTFNVGSNHADGNGGVLYNEYTTMNMSKGGINNNYASNGGAIYSKNSNMTFNQMGYTYNNAKTDNTITNDNNGGFIYAEKSNINITGGTESNNHAGNGGIIYSTESNITIDHAGLGSNSDATENGGAINAYKSNIILKDASLGNSKAVNGGFAYTDNTNLTIINASISSNIATANGGALYTTNGGNINITKSSFTSNTAPTGGALYIGKDTNYTSDSTSYQANHATDNGGAIYNEGNATINAWIGYNRATNNGGAVYNTGNFTITAFGASENHANNGGLIYNTGNTTVKWGSANYNTATQNGGAIYNQKGHVLIDGMTINNNTAANAGEIYNNEGNIDIQYSAIINDTHSSQAAIVNNNANMTITDSTIANNTRAVMNTKSNLTVNKGNFNNNTATEGSVIYNSIESKATITDSNICDNTADNGGALYNNGNITIQRSIFTNNTAGSGGVIYNNGNITIISSTLSKNKAQYGGVIYDSGNSTVINTILNNNSAAINGGAIQISGVNGISIINNSTISNNSADVDGGVIFTSNPGILTINNTSITNNIATTGGIVVNSHKSIIINNTNVTSNKGSVYGVIYNVDEGNVIINNTNVTNNTAFGGTVFNNGILNIQNTNITNNNITDLGGAISNDAGIVTVNNTNIINNTAYGGGAIFNQFGNIAVNNTNITNNKATYGGAIFNEAASEITLNNTNLNYNNAVYYGGAVYDNGIVNIHNTNITDNDAQMGGAIVNAEGSMQIVNTRLSDNNATDTGGAIFNQAELTLNNSIINNNNAAQGGAIFNSEDEDEDGVHTGNIQIINTMISNNNATDNGGAIYNQANVTLNNSVIDTNNATQGGAISNIEGILHLINTTVSNNNATQGGAIYTQNGNMTLVNSTLTKNIVTNTEGYVVFIDGASTIYNNSFYNNTDFERDMLINDNTVIERIYNNIYISNYLETHTNITLEEVTLDVLDEYYDVNIPLMIRDVYNSTVHNGNITVLINGVEYKNYPVKNSSADIVIPKAVFNETVNTLTYIYTSPDLSYQPLTLENTITVIKHNTIITIDQVEDTKYNEKVAVTGILRDTNGTLLPDTDVIITVNGVKYINTTDESGRYTVNDIPVEFGINNITAEFKGNNSYNKSSAASTFNGIAHITQVIIFNEEDTLFDNIKTINGILLDKDELKLIPDTTLTVTINGKTIENIKTDSQGIFTIPDTQVQLDINNVTVKYNGNESFNPSNESIIYYGLKHDTKITLDETEDVLFDGKTTVTGILTDVNGTVIANTIVTVNGKPVTTDGEGRFTTTLDAILGLNTVTVNYIGNGSYNPSDDTNKFNGLKHDTNIIADNIISVKYDETVTITGTLKDVNNTVIGNAKVSVIINGNRYSTTTDKDGIYTIHDVTVQLGQNTVYVNYLGNNSYNPSEYSTEFNGLQHTTEVTVESIPDTLFDNTVTITGVLTDEDTQEIISDAVITVTVNGKDIITATDADGRYTVENIPAILKTNTVKVSYAGNNSHASSADSTEFTGLPHDTRITLDDISDVLSDNKATVTGTLTDINGTVIADATVTVNDVIVTTDASGKFTVDVTAKLDENSVTAVYNGNDSYNKAEATGKYNGLPHNTKITVNTISDIKYGKLVNITGVLSDINDTLIPDARILLTVNDNTYYTVTDVDGTYIVYNILAGSGTNIVKVNYDGSASYNPSENSTEFIGLKHDTKITVNNVTDRLFDDKATLVGVLFDLDDNLRLITDANVKITINDNIYEVITNSTGGYNITGPVQIGNNNVCVSYDGNDYFNSAETTTKYAGLKHATIIKLDGITDVLFDGKTTVTGILADVNGTVIEGAAVVVNGETLTTDTDGKFTTTVAVNIGENIITAGYDGNTSYNSTSAAADFNGLKHETTVTVNSVESTQFDNVVQITGVLSDVNNTLIPDARILLTVNGNTYTTITDENGVYTLNNASVVIGLNNVTVNYDGNNSYIAANNSIVFNGLKHDTVIILDQINNTIFDNTTTVAGILLDVNGNVIPYATVIVNGETLTTDVNGRFTTAVTAALGENTVTAVYYGNDSYTNSNAASKFTGLKHDIRITVNDVNDTLFDNTVNITGVLTDINNTILSDATVNITVNGINYTATTDDNGRYILYNVPVVRGVNYVIASYSGNDSYNEVGQVTIIFNGLAHNTKIILDNADDTLFDNKTSVSGTLLDINGTTIPGATVTVNDAAVITDNNGRFTVNTTANLGKNTITVRYNGSYLYNNASDVTTTCNGLKHATGVTVNADNTLFDKTTTITGVLRDANNTLIGNATVTVTINGVNYTTTTNTDGTYTITQVPVVLGVNNVVITYTGDDSYNATSSTATFNGLPHDTILTVNNVTDTLFDKTVNITGTLRDINNTVIANAPVTVTVNGKTYTTATDENGMYNIINVPAVLDVNDVTASYAGDKSYNRVDDATTTFNGLKHDTIIVLDDVEDVSFNNKTSVSGILLDVNGTIISGAIVTVDNITTATDSDGKFTVEVTAKLGENTPVAVYNGNESYNNASNITVFTGLPHDSIVTVNNIDSTLYDNTVTITGILRDVNGTVIPKADITVTVNGKTYNTITDVNGAYIVQYVPVTLGVNTVTVDYKGDNSYNPSETATTYNGLPHDTIITIDYVNDALFDDTTSITGVLKDVNSTVIGNANIIVNVNGVTYTTTTDASGVYVVNNIPVVFGENTVTARYSGNSSYNPSRTATTYNGLSHNTKITVNNIDNTLFDNTVTVTGVLSDINGSIIPNADVIVRTNNNDYTTVTDANGMYIIRNVPAVLGENNVTVTYDGNASYNKVENSTVYTGLPHDTKITVNNIDNILFDDTVTVTGTLKDVNNTVIPYANITVNINGVNYTTATNTNGVYTVTQVPVVLGNNSVTARYNGNTSYNKAENNTKYNGLPHDTRITVNPINNTLFDNTVNVTGVLTDANGTIISNADVTVNVNDNIYNTTTDANGAYSTTIPVALNLNNVTVEYTGNISYIQSRANTVLNGLKHATIVTVEPINGIIGEKITFTAHVTDVNGTPVTSGNLVFKLNGKTLRQDGSFNSTADPLKFRITNGTVTYTLTADLYLRNSKNISASYSGSYMYEQNASNITTAQILKRDAAITVTTVNTTMQDTDIVFNARITDITPNGTNTTAVDGGYVIFKVNGNTLKDENGSEIHVTVTNNTAQLTYHVPRGMASIDGNGQIRNYAVTAVYTNDIFYPRTRNNTQFHVEKSPITINFKNTTINTSTHKLSVNANITDYKDNLVVGNNKICIKVNGQTIKDENNNTIYYTVHNGNVNLTNITVPQLASYNSVMIVTGDRQAYAECKNSTSNIRIED